MYIPYNGEKTLKQVSIFDLLEVSIYSEYLKRNIMCLVLFFIKQIAANLLFWIEIVNSKVLIPKKDVIIFCNNIRM